MAEEKATQTTESPSSEKDTSGLTTRSPADTGAEEVTETKPEIPKEMFTPLFDEEDYSPEQLTGQESEAKKEEKPSEEKPPQETKPDSPEPKGEEKKGEEKSEEKPEEKAKPEEKPEKKEPPPPGYVPQEALHEARMQAKELRSELNELRDEVVALRTEREKPELTPEDNEWKDFKVLSEKEFKELMEEDPEEASLYHNKLFRYQEYQMRKERQEETRQQQEQQERNAINATVARIEKAIPDIYEDESETRKKLADFALENGFKDEVYLEIMTNPATRIIPAGDNKSYLLGNGAASLIEMINSLANKAPEKVNADNLRAELTKELEPKIREAVTKELIEKFKKNAPEDTRFISELPGASETPSADEKKTFNEAEWAKLSEDKQRELLGA